MIRTCPICGAWAIPGSLDPDAQPNCGHGPAPEATTPEEPTAATIRCADEDEARALAKDFRGTHIVGRVGAALLVRPRAE